MNGFRRVQTDAAMSLNTEFRLVPSATVTVPIITMAINVAINAVFHGR